MKALWMTWLLLGIAASAAVAQKITVVTEEYPPYNYLNDENQVVGISTEVVKEVLKRAGLDYQIDLYPWSRAYKMAQEGPNVLIYSIGRNEKREHLFKWVDFIAPYDVYLYRMKNRTDIKASTLADLKKYTLGAVRDDVRAQYLEKEDIKLELVPEDRANAKKLERGRIDMFPIDELAMVYLYKREGMDTDDLAKVMKLDAISPGLYMAFSLQTGDDIVNKCKKALLDMKKDGSFDKIRLKYLR